MAYHGLIKMVQNMSQIYPVPRILEIGVDKGQSFIPLLHSLYCLNDVSEFLLAGIDVEIEHNVANVIEIIRNIHGDVNIDLDNKRADSNKRACVLYECKSLKKLKEMKEAGAEFDIVLVDGDHNYETVSQELDFINEITHQHSIIICDDYRGKWSKKDLYYADRNKNNKKDMPEVISEKDVSEVISEKDMSDVMNAVSKIVKNIPPSKEGVKAAVDDFLDKNEKWKIWDYSKIMPGNHEPVILHKGVIGTHITFTVRS